MSTFQLFTIVYYASIAVTIIFFIERFFKEKGSAKKLLIVYLKILGLCLVSSLFPFFHFGLLFGFPSILLASLLITFVFRKELS